jgi:glycosyltransferase involved in cell wall biosynthesis
MQTVARQHWSRSKDFSPAQSGKPTAVHTLKIGVVIPVYNRAVLVCQALDSVAAQTWVPLKVIVVDDGSNDDTHESVKLWCTQHPAVPCEVMTIPRSGAAKARNLAAALLPLEVSHIAFLDSDDIWPVDFLHRCSAAFERSPRSAIFIADRKHTHFDANYTLQRSAADASRCPLTFLLQQDAGILSCSLLSRQHFENCGGFPEAYPTGHDLILFGQMACCGPWSHVPGEPVWFRIGFREAMPTQEPHLHRRHPNHLFIWAEAYLQTYKFARFSSAISVSDKSIWVRTLLKRYIDALLQNRGTLSAKEIIICCQRSIALSVLAACYAVRAYSKRLVDADVAPAK